jgi:hypothetical protein
MSECQSRYGGATQVVEVKIIQASLAKCLTPRGSKAVFRSWLAVAVHKDRRCWRSIALKRKSEENA